MSTYYSGRSSRPVKLSRSVSSTDRKYARAPYMREALGKGHVLACLGWAGVMKASVSAASRRHS